MKVHIQSAGVFRQAFSFIFRAKLEEILTETAFGHIIEDMLENMGACTHQEGEADR